MAKQRVGLQKDVSTIFGDAQFQKETGYSNLPDAPAQNLPDSLRPKPRSRYYRIPWSQKAPRAERLGPKAARPKQSSINRVKNALKRIWRSIISPEPTRLKNRHPVIRMLSSPDERRRAQKRFRSIQPGKPPAEANTKNSGG